MFVWFLKNHFVSDLTVFTWVLKIKLYQNWLLFWSNLKKNQIYQTWLLLYMNFEISNCVRLGCWFVWLLKYDILREVAGVLAFFHKSNSNRYGCQFILQNPISDLDSGLKYKFVSDLVVFCLSFEISNCIRPGCCFVISKNQILTDLYAGFNEFRNNKLYQIWLQGFFEFLKNKFFQTWLQLFLSIEKLKFYRHGCWDIWLFTHLFVSDMVSVLLKFSWFKFC